MPLSDPQIGSVGMAEFEEFGLYRCEITGVEGDSLSVFYVDYGNSERKKRGEVFKIPLDASGLVKRLSLPCRIAKVAPSEGPRPRW